MVGEPGIGDGTAPEEAATPVPRSVWVLLRQSRILRIILVVSLTANFALIETTEVALPALAPFIGGLLALAMAYGLTQREFRDFGTPDDFGAPAEEPSPTPA
jgi:hypothetical protein